MYTTDWSFLQNNQEKCPKTGTSQEFSNDSLVNTELQSPVQNNMQTSPQNSSIPQLVVFLTSKATKNAQVNCYSCCFLKQPSQLFKKLWPWQVGSVGADEMPLFDPDWHGDGGGGKWINQIENSPALHCCPRGSNQAKGICDKTREEKQAEKLWVVNYWGALRL